MLLKHIENEVEPKVRERGRSYFHGGAVRIEKGDAYAVDAVVTGSEVYQVHLERAGGGLVSSCTCPFFRDNDDVCKHIWAAILAADSKSFLLGKKRKPPQYLDIADTQYDESWEEGYYDNPVIERAYELLNGSGGPLRSLGPTQHLPEPGGAKEPAWKKELAQLRQRQASAIAPQQRETWPADREIAYIIDLPHVNPEGGLPLEIAWRHRKKDGNWSVFKSQQISPEIIPHLPDPVDRQALATLAGADKQTNYGYGWQGGYGYNTNRYSLKGQLAFTLLPTLCATGRCRLRLHAEDKEGQVVGWDDGPPWEFWLKLRPAGKGKGYEITGDLRRGEEVRPLTAAAILLRDGLVVFDQSIARLDHADAFDWLPLLGRRPALPVAAKELDALLQDLFNLPRLPRLDFPTELQFEETTATPQPRLKVTAAKNAWNKNLDVDLNFDYGGRIIAGANPGSVVFDAKERRLLRRDPAAERSAMDLLTSAGARYVQNYNQTGWELAPRNLPKAVRTLTEAGWFVEAEGKIFRQPGEFNIKVQSGIDWFDLEGGATFGDQQVGLPRLLAALRKGETSVKLDDGTFGMLPEDWLKKYGLVASLGEVEGDHLRFKRSQVGLLDALLAAQPEVTFDATFSKARDELQRFNGIAAVDPPAGFVGQLREYQRDGLGWLQFLRQFGCGGCLADDMGLGKTVQVLALLESRRQERARSTNGARVGPSLVVVPRSLVFNWRQEAARFAPQLRVLDHTGLDRQRDNVDFSQHDLILTTYGTLRRDVPSWKDVRFDYCILDEAQAIKNADSESAKAVRLVQADQRLALSGTPVQNHLGELWSLFDFLNPGMLGKGSALKIDGGFRNPSADSRMLLARALRPYILRRTKEQVAKDLPAKTEQTIFCDLEPEQRKLYNELKEHYRQSLLQKVATEGMAKSKILVLEALLRLRQAACHPGLIDKKRSDEPSAKLELLLSQLTDVIDEGHKVLIFSQFTTLLGILRQRLDAAKTPYLYLDGKTRDRQAKVDEFQNNPDAKLFLISLKAGGLGLNLTAAEYVFLLDPWWNPAVEAQAIDRAHRIGQEKPVFAMRLIARDTVEEKVLELQKAKRDLADAIISADNSLIRDLSRDDLELLLS